MDVQKKFSWSWSRLKNFRACPKRHYEIDLAKNFKEAPSEALTWGDEVHKAMAAFIDKGTPLPPTMLRYEDWPKKARDRSSTSSTVKVENRLGMDEQFRACGFFDQSVWFRCVIDVLVVSRTGRAAVTLDWKTGKPLPEYEQLALSAQVLFANYPQLEIIDTIYVWFGHEKPTVQRYRREDLAEMWRKVMPEVKLMTEAHRTLTYPPNPSGLCKSYCPVKSCTYHGKAFSRG